MEYDLHGSMVSPDCSPQRGHVVYDGEKDSKRVLLSFSGGLLGVVALKWLLLKGYEVSVLFSYLGQECDFEDIRKLALGIGASQVYIEDMRSEFLHDFVVPAIQANACYEGRDLLGTALSRFVIARKQVQIAQKDGYSCVSHGCSGLGNDQCHFELTYAALYPQVEVIAPCRDPEFRRICESRELMIEWCKSHGIPDTPVVHHSGSEDSNMYASCKWGGELVDPHTPAKPHAWGIPDPIQTADTPDKIIVTFKDGRPVEVKGITTDDHETEIVSIFKLLSDLGSKHGIGRTDIVDNNFIGIKSRRLLECPAGEILMAAHQDIEGIAMDKEVMYIREMFTPKFSELVYNGFWFSPEMDFIQSAVKKSQEVIDGEVTVRLYKGLATAVSRTSPTTVKQPSLLVPSPSDVSGYIQTQACRLKAHALIMDRTRADCATDCHKTRNWKSAEAESSSYKLFWDYMPSTVRAR
eukprot:TRINITY_DN18302_c0_g1_i2.p1 TRINITY_DN18302_c0_g1~~TRINITY_DN18302_c0_g1_i2.p1  ORF type:complete len:481 (+),score=103.18 TRINITY_DN18302_c0_g1_i2:47-1444(+)